MTIGQQAWRPSHRRTHSLSANSRACFLHPLKQIFPYRLIIQPSETQIGGVLHETFHVLQMRTAPDRMLAAEAAHRSTDEYSRVAADFSAEWKSEAELLAKALQAKTREDKLNLVHQFLAQRDGRRATFRLDQVG